MNIPTKFGVLAVGFAALAMLLIGFQVSVGGDSHKVLQAIGTLPGWIFYGFMLVVFSIFAFVFKIFYWDLPRAGSKTKVQAEQIAKDTWYIKGASVFERKTAQWLDSKGWVELQYPSAKADKGAVLKLSSTGRKRQELTLAIRPSHPSANKLASLRYLDVVEFEFVEKPLECALETELCAYLVLKI